jgi:RND family efflux transporter MFP subunit
MAINTVSFLVDWAIRSSILIVAGASLLLALRVKASAARLAAWEAALIASLCLPLLATVLPHMPLRIERVASGHRAPQVDVPPIATPQLPSSERRDVRSVVAPKPFDWALAALIGYAGVAAVLLLRLAFGLAMALGLLRRSRLTGRLVDGIAVFESDDLSAPVTVGVVRPKILVPADWREWPAAKLDAVLAHERSHVRRFDPALQFVSALHRAALWHSPLSWFLHRQIVRVAEEVSDDFVVASACDRALYAEALLHFMQRGVRRANWLGVAMARYGNPEQRIQRILDATTLPGRLTRAGFSAILAVAVPITCLLAATHSDGQSRSEVAASASSSSPAADSSAANSPAVNPETASPVQPPAPQSPKPKPVAGMVDGGYLQGLGKVTPLNTVIVRPRIDGQLKSVSFKEGQPVEAGQVIAELDDQGAGLQLSQAEDVLKSQKALLVMAQLDLDRWRKAQEISGTAADQVQAANKLVMQLSTGVTTAQFQVEREKLAASYSRIVAPISGIAGLRQIDPGNLVRAADGPGIVVIIQVQPIAALFTIDESQLPLALRLVRQGKYPEVEAWSRDGSTSLATGRLIAIDNQIDVQTGTATLKAEFENKDRTLFPNQFVNVRMLMK